MPKTTIDGIAGLQAMTGKALEPGPWFEVTQERVQAFADATLDHQWIHIDPARAAAESPFGGPIAHGYLTLSLLPYLLDQIWEVENVKMAVNYGLNKLRYPAPVPVGANVRLHLKVAGVEEVRGGVQCQLDASVEVEGAPKPSMVAEILFRYYA